MNKEDMLLKNFSIMSKNPVKNCDALKSLLQQLLDVNPQLTIRCWETCIRDNADKIEADYRKGNIHNDDSYVFRLINWFENDLVDNRKFGNVVDDFAKNKFLLDMLYTKYRIADYFSAPYAISYLIRKNRWQEADNILSAIYKNKTFCAYSTMWSKIIRNFAQGNEYGTYTSSDNLEQPKRIREYCIGWIERIKDEEEQAGSMTFAMLMFE